MAFGWNGCFGGREWRTAWSVGWNGGVEVSTGLERGFRRLSAVHGGDEIAANGYLFRIAGNPTFGIFTGFRISASVAQLAEQRFCKPQVVGSSPSAGS